MSRYLPLGFLLGMLLGGCASNRYCLKAQAYQSASSVPELQGTGSLQIPELPSALAVPKAPSQRVPFGQEVKGKDGKSRVVCLDQPPPMPPQLKDTGVTR